MRNCKFIDIIIFRKLLLYISKISVQLINKIYTQGNNELFIYKLINLHINQYIFKEIDLFICKLHL